MAAEATIIREHEIERALEAVKACAAREKLAALAYDVLSRQAEGRALYAGAAMIKARAEEHHVERDDATTDAGNLVAILERGAESPLERALIGAFAVAGLGDALAKDAEQGDEKASAERVFRFVRHADWLEVSSEHTVVPFVDALLDASTAGRVWSEMAQAIADDAAGRDGGRPRIRARNAARASALASSSSDAAKEALRRVVRTSALDEPTRLFASTLAGDGERELAVRSPAVEGHLGRVPRRGALEVVRWISGWALAVWALRALAFLLGVRRRAEVRLAKGGLEVNTRVSLLGRTVRERDETWRLDSIQSAGRQVRYPAIHLLVGAIALSIGVLFGGLVLFDGARSGELVLFLLAAVLIVGGAGLDLALDVLVPASKGLVAVDLALPSRSLRLTRVPVEDADVFLRALSSRAGAK
jgi:hypothetical protein